MHRKTRVAAVALMVLISACSSGETVETTSPAITDENTTSETTTTTAATTSTVDTTIPEEATTTTAAPAEPEVMTIDVVFENGSVEGESRITVPLGEDVVVMVVSDVADHVHLHGYDIFADVEPGAPATIEFTADIPGIFELELEDSGERLVELEVTP